MSSTVEIPQFSYSDIENANKRISSFIHKTPILTSSKLDAITGKHLFFKCENFQKTGSFKSRGALNAITHSSGNHGQALAWAAAQCALPKCVVVVPSNISEAKKNAISSYGAQIVECEPTLRRLECDRLSKEQNLVIIDPHDDYDVMAGQGTLGIELLDELRRLAVNIDAIIVSVGGGGLASGLAACVKHINPNIKVFCAESSGKSLEEQLKTKTQKSFALFESVNTIADGIRVRPIGKRCFPTLLEYCEPIVFSLTDDEIISSTKLIYQYLKVVIETSAALPLAAVLKYKEELKDYQNIALILCGGNLCLNNLPF